MELLFCITKSRKVMGEVLMKFWIGKQKDIEYTSMEDIDVKKRG